MTSDIADLTKQIIEFIQQRFPATQDDLDPDSLLLEGGLVDSLGILDIVEHIELTYTVTIDDDELLADNFSTVAEIAAFVQAKLPTN